MPAQADITNYEPSARALLNRWWFQVIVLIVSLPVGIVLLAGFPAYRRRKNGTFRVSKIAKTLLAIVMTPVWLLAFLVVFHSDALADAIGHTAGTIYRMIARAIG